MAVKKVLLTVVAILSVALIVMTARNLIRIQTSDINLENRAIDQDGLDIPSQEDLIESIASLRDALSAERSRYFDDPASVFYQFAEEITEMARSEGLVVLKASVTGRSASPSWELRTQGTRKAVSGFLEALDHRSHYTEYQTLSIQRLAEDRLEAYFVLRLPPRPTIEGERTDELTSPAQVLRVGSQQVASLFRASQVTSIWPSATINSAIPAQIDLAEEKPQVEVVGRYTDSSGSLVFAFKDLGTGRVRQLSVGESNLGWTLLSVEGHNASLLVYDTEVTILLEEQ